MSEDNIFYLTDESVLRLKRYPVRESTMHKAGFAEFLCNYGEDKFFANSCEKLVQEHPEEHMLKNAICKNLVSLLYKRKGSFKDYFKKEKSAEQSIEVYGDRNASVTLGLASEGDWSIFLTNEYIEAELRQAFSGFEDVFNKSVMLSLIKSGFTDDTLYMELSKSLTDREKAELDRYTREFPQANPVSYAAYIYSLRSATYREYMNARCIDEIVDYVRFLHSDEYEKLCYKELIRRFVSAAVIAVILIFILLHI